MTSETKVRLKRERVAFSEEHCPRKVGGLTGLPLKESADRRFWPLYPEGRKNRLGRVRKARFSPTTLIS
jgi:hypothetical protein